MSDFNVRSDAVDVEQIMRQIRARIQEKRGADYTEAELQQLASVKLEKFLDPRGLRSDLVEQFRKHRVVSPEPPKFVFEDTTMYETHRGALRFMRKLLHPILKLFINPNPLIHALHVQAQVNAEFHKRFRAREEMDPLFYEVIHNLVLETTRLGIEVHNLKMRVESLSSRLDFDERRGRSLEGVVQYRPGAAGPMSRPPAGGHRNAPVQPNPPVASPEAPAAPTGPPQYHMLGEQAQRQNRGGRPEGGQRPPQGARPESGQRIPEAASTEARPEGTARPEGARPEGQQDGTGSASGRRRRRRRRRRPGQTQGDRQGWSGPGGPNGQAGAAAGAAGVANAGGGSSAPVDDGGADDGPDGDAGAGDEGSDQ